MIREWIRNHLGLSLFLVTICYLGSCHLLAQRHVTFENELFTEIDDYKQQEAGAQYVNELAFQQMRAHEETGSFFSCGHNWRAPHSSTDKECAAPSELLSSHDLEGYVLVRPDGTFLVEVKARHPAFTVMTQKFDSATGVAGWTTF